MPVIRHEHSTSTRRREAGVSIVEALVALVVLSVGMLGIAGLYLESLRSNRTALSRTAAVSFVNDMADRIRANRGGLINYALAAGAAPTGAVDCTTITCTPAQLALFDKDRWYTAVTAAPTAGGLPRGANGATLPQTSIVFAPATNVAPARYVITAQWLEPGSTDFSSTRVEVAQVGVN